MSLSRKQRDFFKCLSYLYAFILDNGYEATLGDAFRDPRVFGKWGEKKAYSHAKSVHKVRLAIDINLFLDGVYLTDTQDYKVVGEYWESLHPLARWGGRFNDGNHFSFEHEGMK